MATRLLARLGRLLPVLALLCLAPMARAATITIVNLDAAGEGFNDPTPATPVGGNPGTTVGQQRLLVFQQAAALWGSILPSDVTILVDSNFDPLSCDSVSAVLGSAGTNTLHRDFVGAEYANTWYPQALANKLAGADLATANSDLRARFNSSLGEPGCMDGWSWYYGYDHVEGSTQIDLLTVVQHEIAHGLGFATYASGTSGVLYLNRPDVFCLFLYDATTGLHWDEETNDQRAASAILPYMLRWDGDAAKVMAPLILDGGRAVVRVNAPPAIAGDIFSFGTALFGPPFDAAGVTGDVVLAADAVAPYNDVCEPITNAAELAGKIALVDRGTCTFVSKVKNCQDAGAIAVIVADNIEESPPPGMSGDDPTIVIPSVLVTLADGTMLKEQLANGLNVSMLLDTTMLSAADGEGRVMMYTPTPFEPGSSVSHFEVSALPNLLMEPYISEDLTSDVDLTRYVFEDIGWLPRTTTGVPGLEPGLDAALLPNRPNPFAASTAIHFRMPAAGAADLAVFDVSGRQVRQLVRGQLPAGEHVTVWDGTGDDGRPARAGVYFTRLTVGGALQSRRVVFVP